MGEISEGRDFGRPAPSGWLAFFVLAVKEEVVHGQADRRPELGVLPGGLPHSPLWPFFMKSPQTPPGVHGGGGGVVQRSSL